MGAFVDEHAAALVRTLVVVAGFAAAYAASVRLGRRFVARVEGRGREEGRRAQTLWAMLRRLLLVVVVVTLALTVASVWAISIAPFLAVGSAVGVAVGFGAQGVVRDVLAGFLILAEDQYKIGDVVRVAGVAGQVEDIRPRVTVLRDLDGNVHYVPNGEVKVASNLTQRYGQVVLDVAIAPEQPVDRALAVLTGVVSDLAADPVWASRVIEPPEVLGVESIDPTGVVLRAVVKVTAEDRWAVRREALRRVKNQFDAEGIGTALPPVYRRGE